MKHMESEIDFPQPNKRKISENLGQATISHLAHDGRGIAYIDGKITFIFGALPGEEVIFSHSSKKSKYDEAFAIEILQNSENRIEPRCRYFGVCGGCSLQHMEQSSQIELKQSVLLEQLKHFGSVVPTEIMLPLKASPYGYRRKARFSVRYIIKKERVLIGFRELHKPRFLAEIDSCCVLHPSIGNLIAPLQECLSSLENKKHIAQIEAAVGDNATALIIRHHDTLLDSDKKQLEDFAERYGVWVFLQPKGYNSIYKLYPNDEITLLSYPITSNITLNFHPADFTQINDSINKQMIQQALRLLDLRKDDTVLDLFCGIGNFSLPIAEQAGAVYGIEGEASLVKRAQTNASQNHLANVQFFAADLNKVESITTLLPTKFNKILIDPPRSGAREVVEKIDLDDVETIVYVSCNPATLARDAGILSRRGFKLMQAGVMDMFTHTEHVEAMAAFTKQH